MYTKVYQKRLMEKPDKVKDTVLMKLGDSYYFIADYENAVKVYEFLYERAEEKADFEVPVEYNFRYGQSLRAIGREKDAMEKLEAFLDESGARSVVQTTRKYEIQDLKTYIKNLKDSVNLKDFSDFAPVFYKEGLIFSSDRDTGMFHRYRHSGTNKDFLDLYQLGYNEDSMMVINKLNLKGNGINARDAESTAIKVDESTATFSSDGNTMYFTASNFRDGDLVKGPDNIVRLKIYKAVHGAEGWEIADEDWYKNPNGDKSFNVEGYSFANPALSPDNSRLYFTSDMPGSKGLSDLFVVNINDSGIYGRIDNLGDRVNTQFRESFPFVSEEGKLYFSSDRLGGMGRMDVYSVNLNAEGKVASVPENLGEPVNTPYDDFTFIYDSEKEYGFFASNRPRTVVSGSKTSEDTSDNIYAFTAKCINPKVLTGIVRDKVTLLPLAGTTIQIIDDNNEVIASTFTDEEGAYEVTIDRTRNNFVRATREAYTTIEEYLEIAPCELRMVDFYMETSCVDYGTDLAKLLGLDPTIFFDFDKSDIKDDYKDELDIIVDAMILYPSLRIQVNSHTDSRGPNSYNQPLSERRAKATVEYIASKGIAMDRLKYAGYGETKLVNECADGVRCSAAKHQLNRRSEFLILCEEGENCCY
ncbi:cell envelope biogenesis protein OmpA [Muriicola marianensis]|uniref:Cell envelope biogenesis protein OmpA n=2 Tax=Muriicola marianensis TaxID=1324801 RepID=A0ABQ1QSI3_9FLAO|nr:cell envelope biogenesis protein OmpA [Muriicola marianensis]